MASAGKSSVSLVTQGIRISVRTIFVPEQSSAVTESYVFAYQITIRNESDRTVQLLRRKWEILDGFGGIRRVAGDGVVGQQPVLAPGEEHTYTSGSVFKTTLGQMEGYYVMVDLQTKEEFRVRIPPFIMVAPFVLN